jgi:hypothetical protein
MFFTILQLLKIENVTSVKTPHFEQHGRHMILTYNFEFFSLHGNTKDAKKYVFMAEPVKLGVTAKGEDYSLI